MSSYHNPYTGSYDFEQDLKDHPECKAKILNIVKRLHLESNMTHEEIRRLCGLWGSATPGETWNKINSLSDEELRRDVEKVMARRRKRALVLQAYLETQGLVPKYSGAGVA